VKDELIALVICDPQLTRTAERVFIYQLSKLHWNSGHTFEIGRRDLMRALKLSRGAVSDALALLKDTKYILSWSERIGDMHTRSIYTFPPFLKLHSAVRIQPYSDPDQAIAAADLMDRNAKAGDIARVALTLGGARLNHGLLQEPSLRVVRSWFQMGFAPGDFARMLYRHAMFDDTKKPIWTWNYFQAEIDKALADARKEAEAAVRDELGRMSAPQPTEASGTTDETPGNDLSDLKDEAA
jgi:hypothetical protein